MKVQTAESLAEEAQLLRLVVYGEPGTGKTWFGASGALDPLTAPVLYLEFRAQIASLRSNPQYLQAMEEKNLVIISLDEYKDLNHIYTWLATGYGSNPSIDALFNEAPKTVVIDSLTELQRAEVMRIAGNQPGRFVRDVEPPEIQHWGSLLNEFTLLAHLFYQLPYHLVFVGLEQTDYAKKVIGETRQAVGYRLALQGAAQKQFPAYALTVMRLDRAPANLEMHAIGYTYSVLSKTKEQTGMLPAKIGAPTIPKLAKLLLGEVADKEVVRRE